MTTPFNRRVQATPAGPRSVFANRFLQRRDLAGFLPGEIRIVLAEVAVVGCFRVDRPEQVELADDVGRLE